MAPGEGHRGFGHMGSPTAARASEGKDISRHRSDESLSRVSAPYSRVVAADRQHRRWGPAVAARAAARAAAAGGGRAAAAGGGGGAAGGGARASAAAARRGGGVGGGGGGGGGGGKKKRESGPCSDDQSRRYLPSDSVHPPLHSRHDPCRGMLTC